MYLTARFDDRRSYRNGDISSYISSYINSYVDTLEKAELIASVWHIVRFLKSGILIYNSEVPDMTGRRRREEEHRQLQSVLRFTQTQKGKNHIKIFLLNQFAAQKKSKWCWNEITFFGNTSTNIRHNVSLPINIIWKALDWML